MLKYLVAFSLCVSASAALGADPNGYTAQYECRAGAARCNIDVASLSARPCDQIITPLDSDWSKITKNSSATVFCVEPGDHTSKGALTIRFSGTPSRYKVLRYYRPNDTNDEPWRQNSANQAKVDRLAFIGASYWIVNRLTFDPNYASDSIAVHLGDDVTKSSHIILNRVLAQHAAKQVFVQGANDSVIQNSVFRESIKARSLDADGVGLGYLPRNIWVVNNEIYRIHSHGIYISNDSDSPGSVFENNDVYIDPNQWTDCAGNYTPNDPNSPCSDAEVAIGLKSGGISGDPVRVIHNRVWGLRKSDTNVCCLGGTNGQLISLTDANAGATAHAHYVMVRNNIISEAQHGIQTPREGPDHNSIIGNILYRIKNYYAPIGDIDSFAFASLGHWDNNEVYLNTVVSADHWANFSSEDANLDVKCNVIIASGQNKGGSLGAGMTVNYNAFIGTTELTTDTGINTNITKPIAIRSSTTPYAVGSIAQFGSASACTTGTESACFLYMAVIAGTSASTIPKACTTLGCKFRDGNVTWEAIRGPYSYRRKLRTVPGGEATFIPYARAHFDAPENAACDPRIGTKGGVGISDVPAL